MQYIFESSLVPSWQDSATEQSFLSAISSALLMYRICCLFGGLHIEVWGPDGYKYVWSVEVQHVATGKAVVFSESLQCSEQHLSVFAT